MSAASSHAQATSSPQEASASNAVESAGAENTPALSAKMLSPEEEAARNAANGVLTIDLDAIVANWKMLESKAVPALCAGVVKADGYGCGAVQVAKALAKAGCRTFFVATLNEARELRAALSKPDIYVLSGFTPGCGKIYASDNLRPVIGDLTELAEWDIFRRASGWAGGAALHIDTGMNRLGLLPDEALSLLPGINAGNHGISLVMTHLACADEPSNTLNAKQMHSFREVASRFAGIPAAIANSSGIFLGAPYHMEIVRPGAALYGINPTPDHDNPMRPVVDIKARILQVRDVPRGETVGYGATWTARRPTRLAIISAGYADGYFRAAGGVDGVRSAEMIVAGQRCPVAGRISMDLIAIDITDLPDGAARRGQMATLIGDGITVDEVARHFGTIGYEVLTSLGRRYHRVYRGGAA